MSTNNNVHTQKMIPESSFVTDMRNTNKSSDTYANPNTVPSRMRQGNRGHLRAGTKHYADKTVGSVNKNYNYCGADLSVTRQKMLGNKTHCIALP